MKRYEILAVPGIMPGGDWDIEPDESEEGEWVKFEDVEKEKALAVAGAVITIAEGQAKKEIKRTRCNCEKMCISPSYEFGKDSNGSWICPAHGYKRLL